MNSNKLKKSNGRLIEIFTREKLLKIYRFVGGKVLKYLLFAIFVGLALSIVELGLAFGLQGFLLAIGIASPGTISVPSWIPSTLLKTLLYILLITVCRGFLLWAQQYIQGAAHEIFKNQQRFRLVEWAFSNRSVSSSDLFTLFNERTNIAGSAIMVVQTAAAQATLAMILGISLALMSPLITLLVAGSLSFLIIPSRIYGKKIRKAGEVVSSEWKSANNRLIISARNLLLLRIYDVLDLEREKIGNNLRSYLIHSFKYFRFQAALGSLPQVFGVFILCFVVLLSKSAFKMEPGIVLSYFYLLNRFLQAASNFTSTVSQLEFHLPQLSELASWWSMNSDEGQCKANLTGVFEDEDVLLKANVGWHFENVSFSYARSNQPVIKDLSFQLVPGESLVIIGPSGSGKSTLINLMLGELVPDCGSVWITTGTNKYSLNSVRQQLLRFVGYVGPDSFLIEGSIRQNLVYGLRKLPSEDEINDAIIKAECQFIYDLPERLEHLLTDQGEGLSAGQKQRLCLVRALLRKPKVLVLDEATANLDVLTEERLVNTLGQLKGVFTVVAVTHRQAIKAIADRTIHIGSIKR